MKHFPSIKGSAEANRRLISVLQAEISHLETASRKCGDETVSTGSSAINRLLPGGGLVRGTLVEWFCPAAGCGAELLSLWAAREACQPARALVVIDPQRKFYPLAAAACQIDLQQTIVLRETDPQKLLWAIDQSLRCPAVGAVWGDLGEVDERWLRRFQLSAETSGVLGLFIRSQQLRHLPSWSEVQWLVEPRPCSIGANAFSVEGLAEENLRYSRSLRLHLLRCRNRAHMKHVDLLIDLPTGKIQGLPRRVMHGNSLRSDSSRSTSGTRPGASLG